VVHILARSSWVFSPLKFHIGCGTSHSHIHCVPELFFSGEKRPGSEVNTHIHVVGFDRDSLNNLSLLHSYSHNVYPVSRRLLWIIIKFVVKWNTTFLKISQLCINTRELQIALSCYWYEYTPCSYITGNDFKRASPHTDKIPKLPV
jgi:hypothetical protein